MRWTPLTDSRLYDGDTSPLQILKILIGSAEPYKPGDSVAVKVSWLCYHCCVFLCLWWWRVGPKTNGMMFRTRYVAANGPAWARPQIIRLTISVQAGLCLWGPSRYSVYELILGPTPHLFSFHFFFGRRNSLPHV